MFPAPPAGLLTFTENAQFGFPHPSVAPEVTPLTVSYSRLGAADEVTTSVITNAQSLPVSRHSFVVVPIVEGFPA